MIKVKPNTALIQARKSPVILSEEKQDKISFPSQPVIVDAEITNKDVLSEIPKPPNAFMIFAAEWRKKLAVEHPGKKYILNKNAVLITVLQFAIK